MSRVISILDDFFSFFFPNECRVCRRCLVKGEDLLCTHCLLCLPQVGYSWDAQMAMGRLNGLLPLSQGFSFLKFRKGSRSQRVIHAIKYEECPELAVKIGQMFGHQIMAEGSCKAFPDLIVPVPLHVRKLRKRGYNQSAKFGEGLSNILGVPMNERILIRNRATETQTHKSVDARWSNVRGCFSVQDSSSIVGKHILLVDDVMTTGATLHACGEVLLEQGCSQLSVALMAVATT